MYRTYFMFLMCLGIFACSDDKPLYKETGGTFSFEDKVKTINLTVNQKEFTVKATREYIETEQWYQIEVVEKETSAVIGEEVILPKKMEFYFPSKMKESSITFGLDASKIKGEITLALKLSYPPEGKDYSKYTDEIKITIIPSIDGE